MGSYTNHHIHKYVSSKMQIKLKHGRCSFGDGIVYPVPSLDEESESLISSERWDRWGERARPFDERESSSFDEL